MSIVAVLQARTNSQRLPRKVLKPLLGKPMLARQCERILLSKLVDKLIIATSTLAIDDAIVDLASELGIPCYRGSPDDVLLRILDASRLMGATTVVRLTGDCPLIDADIIDQTIVLHQASGNDYTSNCVPATYPDGLDVEICSIEALEQANLLCKDLSIREHATYYIRLQPEQFKLGTLKSDLDFSFMRWTVDESEDFVLVEKIFTSLYPQNPKFSWLDVLALLRRHPEWLQINRHHERNAGLNKSKYRHLQQESADDQPLRVI